MLFRDPFFRYAFEIDLLVLPQFADHNSQAFSIGDDWLAHPLIGSWFPDYQISGVNLHDIIARTFCFEAQRYRTVFAVLITVAVACEEHILDGFAVERNQAEAVSDEFVGQDGCVGIHLDEIDGHGGYFREDDPAEGVCKSQGDVIQCKIDVGGGSLGGGSCQSWEGTILKASHCTSRTVTRGPTSSNSIFS